MSYLLKLINYFESIFFVAVMLCTLAATCALAGVEYHSVAIDGKVATLEKVASEIHKEERFIVFPDDFPTQIDKKAVIQSLVYDKQDKHIKEGKYVISDFSLLTLTAEVEIEDSLIITYDQEKGKILTSVEANPDKEESIGKIKKSSSIVFLSLMLLMVISIADSALYEFGRKKLALTLIVIGLFSVSAGLDAGLSFSGLFIIMRVGALMIMGAITFAGVRAFVRMGASAFLGVNALVLIIMGVVVGVGVVENFVILKIFAFYFIIFLSEVVVIYLIARRRIKTVK